jgi:heterotetrameric sarcosine oxidase delta subunit
MLLVPCPNCGPRDASDFKFGGESTKRPDPQTCTPAEWRDYVHLKTNVAGNQKETWYCRGCRTYFSLNRDTVTNIFGAPAQ